MKRVKKTKLMTKKKNKLNNQPKKESTQTFKVNCDHCEHKFDLTSKQIISKHIEKGVEWRFFECPKCHYRFTTYVGNKEIENLIRFRNTCRAKMKQELQKGAAANQNTYHSYRIQDEQAGHKISGLMAKLKKEINIEKREKEWVSI
ncbi:hypothetical protein [Streptococcus phage Dp-1]|uniref:hypothetical protein n=1 Tax=Pneumococcus phage Dp-1 TaxID=59241 RepID=UPI0001F3E638|nr:hypothetical protein StPhDp-1_gp39 [Streptococcus phage Dp-1]ADT64046.1 hypothetical protein [Streptococcus phage Dp-1]